MSAWKILTPTLSASSCASRSIFTSKAKMVANLEIEMREKKNYYQVSLLHRFISYTSQTTLIRKCMK